VRVSEIKRKSINVETLRQYDDEHFGQQLMQTLRCAAAANGISPNESRDTIDRGPLGNALDF
jgi:hypothetical protein